jgi:hypothetical protein
MKPQFFSRYPIWFSLLAALLLSACAAPKPANDHGSAIAASPWASASCEAPGAGAWSTYRLPGKRLSEFSYQLVDGRSAMAATAQASASALRRTVRVEPANLGSVKFSWKLPGLIQYADLANKEFDDSPVRVVLAFEGDRSKFSSKNAMLSELALMLTGEQLPYATLMYVWCNACEANSVILNPRTDRIRKLALESGPGKLNRWLDYERDVRRDFEKAFGEAPGALTSVSIMTDSDNTASLAKAWYGPITFKLRKP